MPEFVWVALVVASAAVTLAICGALVVGSYFLLQLAIEKRLDAKAQWDAPIPSEELPEEDELTDEERSAQVFAVLEAAQSQDRMSKEEWAEQKRTDEGWSDDDVSRWLADRPLLPLN